MADNDPLLVAVNNEAEAHAAAQEQLTVSHLIVLIHHQRYDEATQYLQTQQGLDDACLKDPRESHRGWLPIHVLASCHYDLKDVGVVTNVDNAEWSMAAETFLRALANAYPEGIRTPNDDCDLPIHCAMESSASVIMTRTLLELHPEGAKHANNVGCLPIHMAAWFGSPKFLNELMVAYPEGIRTSNDGNGLPIHYAARLRSCL